MIFSRRTTATTVFIDFLFLAVLGFVALVVMLLPLINPPASNDNTEPPGNLIVAISWPEGDTDVDLWVMGPGELVPIGYSNKGGLLFNLLRDDLGTMPDATTLNYEHAYTRGIVPGEYIVNVHCYRCAVLPVPVTVEITKKDQSTKHSPIEAVARTTVVLKANGDEKTAIRFRLTAEGKVEPDSLNNIFRPLRAVEDK